MCSECSVCLAVRAVHVLASMLIATKLKVSGEYSVWMGQRLYLRILSAGRQSE